MSVRRVYKKQRIIYVRILGSEWKTADFKSSEQVNNSPLTWINTTYRAYYRSEKGPNGDKDRGGGEE